MNATGLSTSELTSFVGGGVDALVGSCDTRGHPCIGRAVSVELDEARHLTVSLERSAEVALIEAIRETRQVALDLMPRCSFRSLPLRGSDACFVTGDGCRYTPLSDRRGTRRSRVARTDSAGRFTSDPARPRTVVAGDALVAFRFLARGVRDRPSGQVSVSAPAPFAGVPPGIVGAAVQHPHEPLQGHVHRLLEDGVPLAACTVSGGGTPRLARLVPAIWLDEQHLAIALPSGDWMRRRRRAGTRVALYLVDPRGTLDVRMHATWLHAESSGPVVDRLRVRLAALAWHAGTTDTWQFHGADVLAVQEFRAARDDEPLPAAPLHRPVLPELRRLSERMATRDRLDELLDVTMAGLDTSLGMLHSMLWLLETQRQRLVLLASHGYAEPGVGAELSLGRGLAGIAAVSGLPVRIAWLPHAAISGPGNDELPGAPGALSGDGTLCPGLHAPGSQLAVPLLARGRVIGVLFVETDGHERRLDSDDEDALSVLAGQLAASLAIPHIPADGKPADVPRHSVPRSGVPMADRPLVVRYYEHDGSVFLDDDYLIKGVAGALFLKLVRAHLQCGRSEFSTRELRLCAAELRLPDVRDNLYTRLLLLQRRLAERAVPVRIERTGRGRFRLVVERTLRLAP